MPENPIYIEPIGTDSRRGIVCRNFIIRLLSDDTVIGSCNLRNCPEEYIFYTGNIGYAIDEPYRGHHYAQHAVHLLSAFARGIGISSLLICCSPENIASRKTCENLGAELLGVVPIPADCELYAFDRKSCVRYRLQV